MTNAQFNNQIRDQNNRITDIQTVIRNMNTQADRHSGTGSNAVNGAINTLLERLRTGLNHSTANARIQDLFGNNRERPVSGENQLQQADHAMHQEITAARRRASDLTEQRDAR